MLTRRDEGKLLKFIQKKLIYSIGFGFELLHSKALLRLGSQTQLFLTVCQLQSQNGDGVIVVSADIRSGGLTLISSLDLGHCGSGRGLCTLEFRNLDQYVVSEGGQSALQTD